MSLNTGQITLKVGRTELFLLGGKEDWIIFWTLIKPLYWLTDSDILPLNCYPLHMLHHYCQKVVYFKTCRAKTSSWFGLVAGAALTCLLVHSVGLWAFFSFFHFWPCYDYRFKQAGLSRATREISFSLGFPMNFPSEIWTMDFRNT